VRPVGDLLGDMAEATGGLVAGVGGLADAGVREPSLLPGWTRGHVVTHLARNAEGATRLLGWARSGTPSYKYPSAAARAAAIEAGAGRPAAELAADVRETAAALAAAAARMPPGAWQNLVTWTTGQQTPADMVVRSRLAEVLIHHVDLAVGFGAGSWSAAFVREMLDAAVAALNGRSPVPLTARLEAADTGREFWIGGAGPGRLACGTEAELLAWLLGRSDGAALARDDHDPLPGVPSVYLAQGPAARAAPMRPGSDPSPGRPLRD
jgi:maleylpyruvate isomerase